MFTHFIDKQVPASTVPRLAVCTGGVRNVGLVADWLKDLERSFGTRARMIPCDCESMESGGGPVCLVLDELCGRRPLCGETHRMVHRAAVERGCVQRIRCPLGFLLLSVPVRAYGNWLGQLEFGPLGIEQVDSAEFERSCSKFGFSPALRRRLQTALGALRTVRAADIEGVMALVERVAAVIAEETIRATSVLAVQEPPAVAAGRRFAELHLGDRITLVDVARHVALSPDHFSRLFRRTTGVAFGEHVNRRRMENAQRLLLDSSQRVAEIAFACGFDSVPHFNRIFRRVTGTSPTRYRRQIQGAESLIGNGTPAAPPK